VLDDVDLLVGVHPDWRINLPVEPRRFAYVPNIVDEAFFAVARAPSAGTVLYCGGPRRIKGWDLLLAAFTDVRAAMPDARLHAVGWPDDPMTPATPGVRVGPAVNSAELASAMSEAAVVVIPSRYDVSPILLAEAWAAGTPVIATTAGGLAALAPGAAVVVPPESPAALSEAILAVLRGEIDTSELVRAGSERAARHRGRAVVEAHLALYAELAG
jgi:2-deoxystreptamine N-acetyl-D-glucosaminyltransferase/2-deoxystreptamine glucosyltransferase